MARFAVFSFAILFGGFGCGGDDGNGGQADAAVDAGDVIDAPPLTCGERSIPEDLGTITGTSFSAIADNRGTPGGPILLRITGRFDRSAPPNPKDDSLSIRLYEGFAPFEAGFATGTYDLTGSNTNFYTCGACMHIIADYDPGEDLVTQHYFLESGTLNLTEVSTTAGQMVTGTLTNAQFREVSLNDQTTTQLDIPGGCESTLDEIAFTAPVQTL